MSRANKSKRLDLAERLRAIAEELTQFPERWTQGNIARDRNGDPCWVNDKEAVQWCALGFAGKAGDSVHIPITLALLQALPNKKDSISAYNDSVSIIEVISLFERAAKMVEEGHGDIGPLGE